MRSTVRFVQCLVCGRWCEVSIRVTPNQYVQSGESVTVAGRRDSIHHILVLVGHHSCLHHRRERTASLRGVGVAEYDLVPGAERVASAASAREVGDRTKASLEGLGVEGLSLLDEHLGVRSDR